MRRKLCPHGISPGLISILIPIYNHPVAPLVEAIKIQCDEIAMPYEIVAIEDGSSECLEQNGEISSIKDVHYTVHQHNLGRAAIRNYLAEKARFDILLFIDCDSLIVSDDYIKKYLEAMENAMVVYGGTRYTDQVNPVFALHHKFGKMREARSLEARLANPYASFLTNNFCIRKDLFDTIKFDESLTQYGFEDSLLGWELKKREIPITHIENPVLHTGLDTADAFVQKTKLAVENAWTLIASGKMPKSEIRMVQMYTKLQQWGIASIVCGLVATFEGTMLKNLKSRHPKLVYLDLLKLKWSAQAQSR